MNSWRCASLLSAIVFSTYGGWSGGNEFPVSPFRSDELEKLELPKPSGSYQVGTSIFHWTDKSRRESALADQSRFRELVVQIWYPAGDKLEGPRSPYIPMLEAYRKVWGSKLIELCARIETHSMRDASFAEGLPYPVV